MVHERECEQQKEFMDLCIQPRFNLRDLVIGDKLLTPEVLVNVQLWTRLIREEITQELFLHIETLTRQLNFRNLHESELERTILLAQIADDIVDSKYVLDGLGNMLGIPLPAVFDEVHTANMRKAIRDENGKLIIKKRPDGKILKSANWYPGDIQKVIRDAIE